jgi:hypothetical protein
MKAPTRGPVLVVAATERLAYFRLQRFLDDLPHGELEQSARASPSVTPCVSNSLSFWLARSGAGILVSTGMPPLAAGAKRRLGFESKQECIPVSFSVKYRTSPLTLATISYSEFLRGLFMGVNDGADGRYLGKWVKHRGQRPDINVKFVTGLLPKSADTVLVPDRSRHGVRVLARSTLAGS